VYSAEISRRSPTCFLFLIDQTGSMAAQFGEWRQTKSQALADAVNRLLQDLVIRSAKADGIRDYFSCGVIGFGRANAPIDFAWAGPLVNKTIVPISEIADGFIRMDERDRLSLADNGSEVRQRVRMPVWLEPTAEMGQPARGHHNLIARSCELAHEHLKAWILEHPDSFPPTVSLVTDGGEEGGNPQAAARRLRSLHTSDGNALLFSCHISESRHAPLAFPAPGVRLPEPYADMLFEMSSPLPSFIAAGLRSSGTPVSEGARGFVFNAEVVALIQFLNIGTSVGQMGPRSR